LPTTAFQNHPITCTDFITHSKCFTNIVKHFTNIVKRFTNTVKRFTNTVKRFTNTVKRFTNILKRFTNTVKRFTNILKRFTNILKRFTNIVKRFTNTQKHKTYEVTQVRRNTKNKIPPTPKELNLNRKDRNIYPKEREINNISEFHNPKRLHHCERSEAMTKSFSHRSAHLFPFTQKSPRSNRSPDRFILRTLY
jgi:hypothetical protein